MGNRRSHCAGGFPENLTDTIPSNNQKKGPQMGKDGQFTNKTTSRTTVRDRPTNWKRINDSLLPKVQQVFGNLFMFNSLLNCWEENQKPTQSNSKSNVCDQTLSSVMLICRLSLTFFLYRILHLGWKSPQPRMLARP